MTDAPPIILPSKMDGPADYVLEVTDEFERRLIERALNRPRETTLRHALSLVYSTAGAIALSGRSAMTICFESGPDLLRLKGIWPKHVALMAGRQYDLVDFWGDPLAAMEVKHVWLRTSMDGREEHDITIANGTPGKGGSYQATIVGDPESLSVYTEEVSLTPIRVRLDMETAREILEFRRLVETGQEIT
jgi:hypothetical protein